MWYGYIAKHSFIIFIKNLQVMMQHQFLKDLIAEIQIIYTICSYINLLLKLALLLFDL